MPSILLNGKRVPLKAVKKTSTSKRKNHVFSASRKNHLVVGEKPLSQEEKPLPQVGKSLKEKSPRCKTPEGKQL